jgi:spermidine/putrescine transport system permease protein
MSGIELARARTERRIRWLLISPALVIVILGAIAPLVVILVYSFLAPGMTGGVSWKFSFDGWIQVLFDRDIFDRTLTLSATNIAILVRSLILSLATTLLCLVVGFPTAYFIATRNQINRDVWLLLVTVPFWTNLLIRTFAIQDLIRNEGIINTILLKTGLISAPIQMLFTNFAIFLGLVYVYLPLMILPLYASLERLDRSFLEAATDLYARPSKVLWEVIIPLAKPGIIAGSILVFIPAIGTYVTPILLGGGRNLMIGNYIELQFGQGHDWPFGSALSLTLMAIVMVALLVYIRHGETEEPGHA